MTKPHINPHPSHYQQKFADFIRRLSETEEDIIMVDHPHALGDTFEEIVESPNRIADAEKKLVIVPTADRK